MPDLFLPQSDTSGPYNTDFWNKLAAHLWEMKMHFHNARKPVERRWAECDEAYFCYRYLPDTGTIDWVDDSEWGETDLRDAINLIAIRLGLTLFPRNGGWVQATSRMWEAQSLVEAVQDQQISLHEGALTRRNGMRVIKQAIIRNCTALWWEWRNKYRTKRLSSPESAVRMVQFLTSGGMPKREAKKLIRQRVNDPYFSGPVMRAVDLYDVFIDPATDLTNDLEPAKILQTFRRLTELRKEKDFDGALMYQNLGGSGKKDLDEIVPYDAYDIWNNTDFAGGRIASQEILGDAPNKGPSFNKLVPVYIFHLPYIEWEGEEFWDTYFHVALSQSGQNARIVRVEENPNDAGHPQLIMENYEDWITSGHYGGIGGVFPSLSKYRQLNVIEALTLQAGFAALFPGNLLNVDALIADQEMNFSPGSTVPVQGGVDLDNVIKNLPVPERGLQLGEQGGRIWSDKLRAQMGVDALDVSNPAKTATSRRTATEINRDTTAGSLFLDNQAEQFTPMFNKYLQGVYDASRQHLRPDAYGEISYEKYVSGKVTEQRMLYEDLDVERTIKLAGLSAIVNKAQRMDNLTRGIEVMQPYFATAPQIVMPYAMKAFEEMMAQLDIYISAEEKQQMAPMPPAIGYPPAIGGPVDGGMMNDAATPQRIG